MYVHVGQAGNNSNWIILKYAEWIFFTLFFCAAVDLTGKLTANVSGILTGNRTIIVKHAEWIFFTVFERAAIDLTGDLTGNLI